MSAINWNKVRPSLFSLINSSFKNKFGSLGNRELKNAERKESIEETREKYLQVLSKGGFWLS